MATYVNNLRLTELATGEGSGTWGTTTNTSLELIGEALGYNTQDCFSSDADATTTIADGATDPARAFYFKVTSSATLTATRTLTIAPNTISRVMFIENATTGSQSITISQGTGANVTIATGKTAVVYLDGAGATAAVVDAMANVDPGVTDTLAEVLVAGNTSSGTNIELTTTDKVQFRDSAIFLNSSADGQLDIDADTEVEVTAPTIDLNASTAVLISNDLKLDSDSAVLGFGADNDVTLTHIADTALRINSDNAIQFRDSAISIKSAADGQLDIDADVEVEITAPTVDLNGALDVSGDLTANSYAIPSNSKIFSSSNNLYIQTETNGTGIVLNSRTGFLTFQNNTSTVAQIGTSAIVFNEQGGDIDFRVESNNNANMFFIDAGNNTVNIARSSGPAALNVQSDSGADGIAIYGRSSDEISQITNYNSTGTGLSQLQTRTQYTELKTLTDVPLYFSPNNALKLKVSTSETVVNESSVDHDFRVESNNISNMLFVDAGNDTMLVANNITISANEIDVASGDLTVDVAGDIILDADGAQVRFRDGGTEFFKVSNESGFVQLYSPVSNSDIKFDGNDGGSAITALTLDMSEAGFATFNNAARATTLQARLSNHGGDVSVSANQTGNAYLDLASTASLILGATSTSTVNSAKIVADHSIGSTGDHRQMLTFHPVAGNSQNYEAFRIRDIEIVANETGIGSQDFRVESDGASHMLFVDAGNNRVGINESSPASTLHVTSAGATIRVEGTSGDATVMIERSDSAGAVDYGRFSVRNSAAVVSDTVTRGVGSGRAEIQTYLHDGSALNKRHTLLYAGGSHEIAALEHVRWITASSNFNNPTLNLVTATGTGTSYSQCCFEVTMYGNGVSANEHQVFRGGGTFNFDETVSPETAQNLTTYTNYHKGNGLPSEPSFALSGNTLQMTCNRQTNYDFYRVEIRVWGRAITTSYSGYA